MLPIEARCRCADEAVYGDLSYDMRTKEEERRKDPWVSDVDSEGVALDVRSTGRGVTLRLIFAAFRSAFDPSSL